MIKNTKANDYDRAIISGHYVFSEEKFTKIKEKVARVLKRKKKSKFR